MVGLAEQPPEGKAAFPVTSEAYAVRAEIDLGTVYDRLRKETLRLLEDFSQRGLEGSDLADAVVSGLKDLSDTPIDQAGRGGATEAFNLGRNLAAQSEADQIQEVVRSAIFDVNTCRPCRLLDGIVFELNGAILSFPSAESRAFVEDELGIAQDDPNAYFMLFPPNECDGWDLCRCIDIFRRVA